jgi:hypothetical protein
MLCSQKGKCFNLILNGIEIIIKIVWLEMKGIRKGWICKEGRLDNKFIKNNNSFPMFGIVTPSKSNLINPLPFDQKSKCIVRIFYRILSS